MTKGAHASPIMLSRRRLMKLCRLEISGRKSNRFTRTASPLGKATEVVGVRCSKEGTSDIFPDRSFNEAINIDSRLHTFPMNARAVQLAPWKIVSSRSEERRVGKECR